MRCMDESGTIHGFSRGMCDSCHRVLFLASECCQSVVLFYDSNILICISDLFWYYDIVVIIFFYIDLHNVHSYCTCATVSVRWLFSAAKMKVGVKAKLWIVCLAPY